MKKSSGWKANFARFGQNIGQKYDFIDKTFGFREGVYNAIKKQNPDAVEKFSTMLQIYRNNNNDESFEGYKNFVKSIIDILAVSAKQQIHSFINMAYGNKRPTKYDVENYVSKIDEYSSHIQEILNDKGSFILKAVYNNTPNTSNTIIGQASISPNANQPGGGIRFNKTRRKKQNKKRKRKYSKKR